MIMMKIIVINFFVFSFFSLDKKISHRCENNNNNNNNNNINSTKNSNISQHYNQ